MHSFLLHLSFGEVNERADGIHVWQGLVGGGGDQILAAQGRDRLPPKHYHLGGSAHMQLVLWNKVHFRNNMNPLMLY